MLKYPCLILDHDDTVVQSETTINYPFFCDILDVLRPGAMITLEEYIDGCFHLGFTDMCKQKFNFTDQELNEEYAGWKSYIQEHIPAAYPGIERIIKRQKELGGLLCVVSHSSEEIIRRDYRIHFGILPDETYGWDCPEHQRKPNPYPLEQIMKKYELGPQDLIVIDDLKPAYDMASKVGVPIGFAQWSKQNLPEICKLMNGLCNYSFETVEALEHFLFD